MEFDEYQDRQRGISRNVVDLVVRLLSPFRGGRLSQSDWIALLEAIFPHVEQARREAAELARDFFDLQREQHFPEQRRHDVDRAYYDFRMFVEAMEPERHRISQPGATSSDTAQLGERVMKEVENGGRKTLIQGVESDPRAKGWARVATGRETCAFCLMLISRGAVYTSAENAGLDSDDTTATELFQQGDQEALDQLRNRWHPDCDCKIVPVFDRRSWPGRDAYKRAENLWIEYSKRVDEDPSLRTPQNGNQYGPNNEEWSKGKATLAALKRDLENGEIDNVETFSPAA